MSIRGGGGGGDMEFVKKYLRSKKSVWRLQSVYVVDQVGRVL